MKTYQTMQCLREVGITCDVCKKELNIGDMQNAICINVTQGYASLFGDGCTVQLDICELCLKTKLGEYLRAEPGISAQ